MYIIFLALLLDAAGIPAVLEWTPLLPILLILSWPLFLVLDISKHRCVMASSCFLLGFVLGEHACSTFSHSHCA